MAVRENPSGFDYKAFLAECNAELKSVLARLKKIDYSNPLEAGPLAYALTQAVVAKIEEKAELLGGLTSETKHQIGVDLISGQVQFKGLSDEEERQIISHLIRAAVPIFNILLGKKWPKGIFKIVAKVVGWIKKIF